MQRVAVAAAVSLWLAAPLGAQEYTNRFELTEQFVRLTWSQITDRSAHWESHRSLDDGKTWTTHWEVDFTRKEAK